MRHLTIVMLVSTAVLTGACATPMPREQRQTQFVENTTVTKSTAYNRSLAYVAKNWGDSNQAVKMKDADSGQIIVKGNTSCNALRQAGDVNEYSLSFNLDLQTKDNRVRFGFEDLEVVDDKGKPTTWAYNQITSAEKLEAVKPCLTNVKTGIMRSLASTNNDW